MEKDLRDIEPVLKKTELNIPITDLILKHTSVPSEWTKEEPFCKYGHVNITTWSQDWKWNKRKINEAPEVDLWKMYGLCNQYWLNQYKYRYDKEVKEFRNYTRINVQISTLKNQF